MLSFMKVDKAILVTAVSIYYGPGLMILPTVSAIKSNNVADDEQGAVQGAIVGVSKFSEGLAPMLYGILFKTFSKLGWPNGPFCLSFILGIIATIIAITVLRTRSSSYSMAEDDSDASVESGKYLENDFGKPLINPARDA